MCFIVYNCICTYLLKVTEHPSVILGVDEHCYRQLKVLFIVHGIPCPQGDARNDEEEKRARERGS